VGHNGRYLNACAEHSLTETGLQPPAAIAPMSQDAHRAVAATAVPPTAAVGSTPAPVATAEDHQAPSCAPPPAKRARPAAVVHRNSTLRLCAVVYPSACSRAVASDGTHYCHVHAHFERCAFDDCDNTVVRAAPSAVSPPPTAPDV